MCIHISYPSKVTWWSMPGSVSITIISGWAATHITGIVRAGVGLFTVCQLSRATTPFDNRLASTERHPL